MVLQPTDTPTPTDLPTDTPDTTGKGTRGPVVNPTTLPTASPDQNFYCLELNGLLPDVDYMWSVQVHYIDRTKRPVLQVEGGEAFFPSYSFTGAAVSGLARPENFRVSAATHNSLTLSWTPPLSGTPGPLLDPTAGEHTRITGGRGLGHTDRSGQPPPRGGLCDVSL